ncbi:MAG TPA: DegV family protein [Clostridiales bacterium]|nr:DegV family protein [Clostridiales bacterium]
MSSQSAPVKTAVKIVTDSVCDLPQRLIEQYRITVVPALVHFGLEQYRDRVEISVQEFMRRLPLANPPPKTSQPPPGAFLEAYEEATKDGSPVVSIHVSSRMSGTYQSAMVAKSMLADRDIEVYDSLLGSIGQGWVVLAAAREALAGKSKQEILATVARVGSRMRTLIVVDTLEYLARNGRVGRAQAWMGSMLRVKPILTVVDGVIEPLEKVLGGQRVLHRLVQLVDEGLDRSHRAALGIIHADAEEQALRVKEALEKLFKFDEVIIAETGPAIAANVGPGAYGVMLYQY